MRCDHRDVDQFKKSLFAQVDRRRDDVYREPAERIVTVRDLAFPSREGSYKSGHVRVAFSEEIAFDAPRCAVSHALFFQG